MCLCVCVCVGGGGGGGGGQAAFSDIANAATCLMEKDL